MKMKKHNKQAVKRRGKYSLPLVSLMKCWTNSNSIAPGHFRDASKTFLDSSCGGGNFLVEILKRKMDNSISHLDALKSIYGIEIHQPNVDECKRRLSLGSTDKEIWKILNHNIVCADSLDDKHPGWNVVGYMWEPNHNFF